MTKNLLFILLLLLFSSEILQAQSEVYLDTEGEHISLENYTTLLENKLKTSIWFTKNDTIFFRIFDRHQTGQLSKKDTEYFYSYIQTKSDSEVSKTKPILLAYLDSIHGIASTIKNEADRLRRYHNYKNNDDNAVIRKFKGSTIKSRSSEKLHERFVKRREKCEEELITKFNTQLHYIIRGNDYPNKEYIAENYISDEDLVITEFFFPIKYLYNNVLIMPDGNYLLSHYINEQTLHNINKSTSWLAIKSDLKKSIIEKKYVGIFGSLNTTKRTCIQHQWGF